MSWKPPTTSSNASACISKGYDLTPSEMFHRQCYMTGWYDRAAIEARHYLGVDNIMWETNFPQATSTWPTDARPGGQEFSGRA